MTVPRIGSLFTGTGALDMAVQAVFGAEVAWHSQYEPPDKHGREDTHQYAAKILEYRFPGVPNLGDITKIDWQRVLDEHGPVDILTGGFPCQDVSSAGKQAGLVEGTRSGLWLQMAHAIAVLRPRLVVIENVEGLLSTKAASDVEPCAHCVGDPDREPPLRALGAVLGDLASLGFDAEWARVAASEIGAPHPRKRVFVLAWPASADAADLGHERGGLARGRWPGLADGDQVAADADGRGREGDQERDRGPVEGQPACERGLDAVGSRIRREAPADAAGVGHGDAGAPGVGGLPAAAVASGAAAEPRCPTCGCPEYVHDAGGFCADCTSCTDPELGRPDEAASDAQGVGRGEGRTEPARQQGRPDAAVSGGAALADADGFGRREAVLELRPGQSDVAWGDYEAAVRQWERILGRPVPWPTDLRGRLSPVFTEWMMGLPDGWVTAVPGLTRNAMLKALGNGVVWQQAEAALHLLLARIAPVSAAA